MIVLTQIYSENRLNYFLMVYYSLMNPPVNSLISKIRESHHSILSFVALANNRENYDYFSDKGEISGFSSFLSGDLIEY